MNKLHKHFQTKWASLAPQCKRLHRGRNSHCSTKQFLIFVQQGDGRASTMETSSETSEKLPRPQVLDEVTHLPVCQGGCGPSVDSSVAGGDSRL